MAKRKSPQELMQERNPLSRKNVDPVDIYTPQIQSEPVEPKKVSNEELKKALKANGISVNVNKDKETRPYSTYLSNDQVKGIKLRAVNSGQKDQHIVQAAINEYFERHKLN